MKKVYAFLAAVTITISVISQVPERMSYQAVIRNSDNILVTNHAVGMRISILQGSVGGNSVYTETHSPLTNTNGLVTLEIGGGTVVSGTYAEIDWSAGTYFIKTETDPTGGTNYTIVGTSQLLSVPYALYAKTAGTATDAAPKDYVDELLERINVLEQDAGIFYYPKNGLLARWTFENNLSDSGPGGYNLSGSANYSAGIVGNGLSASEVYTDNSSLKSFIYNNSTWTVSLWFKSGTLPNINTELSPIMLAVDGPNSYPFQRVWISLGKWESTTKILVSRYNASTMDNRGNVSAIFGSSYPNLDDSIWHHLTVCYTGTSISCYIDNVQVPADGFSYGQYIESSMGTSNATAVTICGNQQNNSGNFNGLIDQVYIYNIPLKSSDVEQLFREGGLETPPEITDIDGNKYKTVKIGSQVWMAENLKASRYVNGDIIPNITDNESWKTMTFGALCYYNNDEITYKDVYGALYTHFAVVDSRKLCPIGFHIPSEGDWKELTDYLTNYGYGYEGSGNDIAKSLATKTGWTISSVPGTPGNNSETNNSSGFSVMPGGYRDPNGLFMKKEDQSKFRSSFGNGDNMAYGERLDFNLTNIIWESNEYRHGLSVRCIKD